MHHSKMHPADFRRVVVQERDDPIFERCCDFHLFVYLAFDPGAIRLFVQAKSDSSSSFI